MVIAANRAHGYSPATVPFGAAANGVGSTAAIAARGHVLFRQGGWGYLLPAQTLMSVLGSEYLRPLPAPVEGWSGTVAMQGGALPVLNAASLLGHGGAPSVVLLLRVGSTQ